MRRICCFFSISHILVEYMFNAFSLQLQSTVEVVLWRSLCFFSTTFKIWLYNRYTCIHINGLNYAELYVMISQKKMQVFFSSRQNIVCNTYKDLSFSLANWNMTPLLLSTSSCKKLYNTYIRIFIYFEQIEGNILLPNIRSSNLCNR